jgi:DNA polymerase elongation subunit (family B)
VLDLPFYGLDFETDTSVSPTSGLDPRLGGITSAALAGVAGLDLALTRASEGHELALLERVEATLAQAEPGVVVTWNGAVFDLPFFASRSALLGVSTTLVLEPAPELFVKYAPTPGFAGAVRGRWGKHLHLDVQYTYRSHSERTGVKWSLKPVAKSFGLEPVEVDRERIHLLSEAEERAYVTSDAAITRTLALFAQSLGQDLDLDQV